MAVQAAAAAGGAATPAAFNFRNHVKPPCVFTGAENAIAHWRKWQDYCRLVGWGAPGDGEPDNRVVNFVVVLCDSAREWYDMCVLKGKGVPRSPC